MGLTPQQIETAIHTKLATAAASYAYAVEQYNGRAGSLEDLASWIGQVQVPALAVFYGGSDYDPTSRSEERMLSRPEASFMVWIITDTLRDVTTRFQEKKGLFVLSQIVYGTLMGSNLALPELDPMYFLREGPLLDEPMSGRTVWQMEWRTAFRRSMVAIP